MKLKLVATIKKEALLPGMEQAIQDVQLQKEIKKPGITQIVDAAEQTAMNQLVAKYPRKGDWNGENLEKDLKSYMQKFHPDKSYGIGVAKPDLQGLEIEPTEYVKLQKNNAVKNGLAKAQNQNASARQFFTDYDQNVYVLVY